MPVYEFQCECGKVTEDLVRMGTESISCPNYGKTATKIMSRCTFELKGGGWYTDGYSSARDKASSSSGKNA